jgi:DNA topoisomerase-6 subunit A
LLACGNGYPGRSFHRVLRSLHDQLAIPFYVLADNDPGGIFFFFLIARGVVRRRSKPDKSIAIRDACFLGLRTEDPARIGLADIVHINLSENEITQLLQLKTTGWIASRTQWLREIEQLQARGTKVEVEALGVLSLSYLAETFLPNRLASGDGLRLQLPWVLNAQHYRNWFLQI